MRNNNLSSSLKTLRNKSFHKVVRISLFLASLALGTVQSAEVPKTQEALFAERNNNPYLLEDIKTLITPILDKEIEQDFWPVIEAMFDTNFPKPVHSPLKVFKNWNDFIEKLKKDNDKQKIGEVHPQILTLRGSIICHHFDVFTKKYPHLKEIKLFL